MFLIGKKPTGSKDPFGLRRSALGVIRILIENKIELNLKEILKNTATLFKFKTIKKNYDYTEILGFIGIRLTVYLKDKGFSGDVINSVYSGEDLNPYLIYNKCKITKDLREKEDAINFLSAYRRINSIIKDSNFNKKKIFPNKFTSRYEEQLYENIMGFREAITKRKILPNYSSNLNSVILLTSFINYFFDNVTVNSKDSDEKNNRLNLLFFCKETLNLICDFSKIKETK